MENRLLSFTFTVLLAMMADIDKDKGRYWIMTTRTISTAQKPAGLTISRWLIIGLQAAAPAILAVLAAQAAILRIRPALGAFKPLDSYARSVLFTLIPAIGAALVFAWLVKTQEKPVVKFLWVATGFLLLSFIPDYILPVPYRTLAASTAAAFLHLLAGIIIVAMLLAGYSRSTKTRINV
jgi:hypothetical protein